MQKKMLEGESLQGDQENDRKKLKLVTIYWQRLKTGIANCHDLCQLELFWAWKLRYSSSFA